MSWCCSGCGLGLPSFPVSPIYNLLNLPDDVLISVWNNGFMTLPGKVLVLVCTHFPSLRYTLRSSPSWCHHIPVFTTTCFIMLLYRFALNIFPSWKRWLELKLLRAGRRTKSQLEVKDEKEQMPSVHRVAIVAEVYGEVCQLYLRLLNTTLAT